MSFINVAKAVGLEKYPPHWDEIYDSIQGEPHPCSRELIVSLQEKYQLFGSHYESVLAGWEDTLKKPEYLSFIHTAVRHMERENGAITSIRNFPDYVTDGSPAGDMALLFVHLPRTERGMKLYLDRNFTPEKVRESFHCLEGGMNVHYQSTGRSGMNKLYFSWTSHYIDCRIFDHEGFNYEMKSLPKNIFVLRNKLSREVVIITGNKAIHRSGRILGTADFEDEEGSFEAPIVETEEEIIAHPVRNLLVSREAEHFSRKEWEVVLKPDDEILGIHIPRGTDLSPEHVDFANHSALEFVRKYFPQFHPKAFHCSSWLLEPAMEEILGRPGKISGFGNLFCRYPNKSAGKEVFSFVFGPKSSQMAPEELPETTSLHRALKKIYCAGKHIHSWSGVILLD